MATCFSGGVYGDASCAVLDTCLNTCTTLPVDQQGGCMRDCYQTGTEEAVTQQVAIVSCASSACATALDQQACLQAAMSPAGECAEAIAACTN